MTCDASPAAWARQREDEGWHVLGCADHFWSTDRPFPHVWVTLATMAAATTRVQLTSSFANNLFRSPVEFAQAALQLQAVSDGRFEAGLGAGWSKDEAFGSGIGYPTASDRAGRFIEAAAIVRALLDDQKCTYHGKYYDVDVPIVGPRPSVKVPFVASLGGARTIAGIAPIVDRVELKLISSATREGALDVSQLRSIPRSHLDDLVAKVRAVNPMVPLGVFILCSAGADPRTRALSDMLGDSFLGGFFGEPAKVADSIRSLAAHGITRVQVSPFNDDTFSMLADALL